MERPASAGGATRRKELQMGVRVIRESDVAPFLERVGAHLSERPAENNLMLGLLGDFARRGGIPGRETSQDVPPVLLAVEGPRGIEGVAMQTPPRALIVSRMTDEATERLVEFVLSAEVSISGVNGPDATAERFASVWRAQTGHTTALRMTQTIYELAEVRSFAAAPGLLREANTADERLLAAWSEAFHRETGLDAFGDHLALVRGKMAAGQLFVWENATLVSMAAWTGRTDQGVRVAYVYTPPAVRKKGYASAVVAGLSQRLLDEGCPRCFLFTNAANPTSNKIYRALGYEPVSDFRLYQLPRR
jgi:uncharacterized protein